MVATGKALIGNRLTTMDATGKLKISGLVQWLGYSQVILLRSSIVTELPTALLTI
ncbi:MAG: hypothetical protein ACJA2Q_001888 [Pseudohongiellaceae bacterium]|jgi:hypothetical protein